jgi:hypothetical protein
MELTDKFIREDIGMHSSDRMVPYRAFDLMKFYEIVKMDNEVVGIEMDQESKVISFVVIPKGSEIKDPFDEKIRRIIEW